MSQASLRTDDSKKEDIGIAVDGDSTLIRAQLLQEYSSLKCEYQRHIDNNQTPQIIPIQSVGREREIIELLHEYNHVKDACQIVLGAAANLSQCTIKDMHLKYNLPLDE